MNKLTAQQFRDLVSFVDFKIGNVSQCLGTVETARGIESLKRGIAELDSADLARKNERLECERDRMMGYALSALNRSARQMERYAAVEAARDAERSAKPRLYLVA